MHTLNLKYFYMFGILLLLLNFSYAKEDERQYNIPASISTLIENAEQDNAMVLIDQTLEKKKSNLLKTTKKDVLKYIFLYDEISRLIIMKNKLLMEMEKENEVNTDKVCNFILDYEEVEFIKTQFYKTPFHDSVAETVQNIASLYELCHPPMAEKYLKSVLQIKENIYSKESIQAAGAHDALGDYYRLAMANFQEAISHYEDANKIREDLFGKSDPRITENYSRLATCIFYHGDPMHKAEKLLLQSIVLRKESSSDVNFPLYRAYMDAGMYYSMVGNYTRSIITLIEAKVTFVGKQKNDYDIILRELSAARRNINSK